MEMYYNRFIIYVKGESDYEIKRKSCCCNSIHKRNRTCDCKGMRCGRGGRVYGSA